MSDDGLPSSRLGYPPPVGEHGSTQRAALRRRRRGLDARGSTAAAFGVKHLGFGRPSTLILKEAARRVDVERVRHGRHRHRPPPSHVDEVIAVPAPSTCPRLRRCRVANARGGTVSGRPRGGTARLRQLRLIGHCATCGRPRAPRGRPVCHGRRGGAARAAGWRDYVVQQTAAVTHGKASDGRDRLLGGFSRSPAPCIGRHARPSRLYGHLRAEARSSAKPLEGWATGVCRLRNPRARVYQIHPGRFPRSGGSG